MALEVAATLTAVGTIVLVAFTASIVFRRWHVPDILPLILLGGLLGPYLGFLDTGGLQDVMPFVAAVAVILVLFDGSLEVNPRQIGSAGRMGGYMAITMFSLTTIFCAAIAVALAGMAWPVALLLGMTFGGAGVVIIVPLARRMGIQPTTMTAILFEAVVSDVFVIVGVYAAATFVALPGQELASVASPLAVAFLVPITTGLLTGWFWSRFLASHHEETNAYIVTLALLFLLYAATEVLGGSGPLAVLVFGIILGNSRRLEVRGRGPGLGVPVFGSTLVSFHQEILFFTRAFFFVALGAVADWTLLTDLVFVATGLALALGVVVARITGAWMIVGRRDIPRWDKTTVALMFPLGLVTAAVSVIPWAAFQIPGTDVFPAYAMVVILLTNVLATIAVFVGVWRHKRGGVTQEAPMVEGPSDALGAAAHRAGPPD